MTRQPPFEVLEQAAEWYAELRCGVADTARQQDWQHWLAADPMHRVAWEAVRGISQRFEPLQQLAERRSTADSLLGAHQRVRRRAALRCFAALAGAGVLWASWRLTPLPLWGAEWVADYRSGTGELKSVQLADGTHVWLNTRTAFDVAFSRRSRKVHLLVGEILVDTAHDAQRPFIVRTAHGRMRALGTRFSVRVGDDSTLLSVFAGAVEVTLPGTGETRVIAAGQQQSFGTHRLEAPGRADLARQAWTEGMLVAADIELGEVLDELSRYHHGYISVSPQVARLKVFGNLPLLDFDSALAMLGSSLPIRVERRLPWWTTVGPTDN
ncbi:FecR domain-containing protein [Pseudomonas sp. 148P]|uniref:FecR domain-containing protein n=1 Tax=Pseudomonas ulcerans TaxID=3115852 RepID=A0ABU7HS36_9PSED|nr:MULTISPECIES: FecR domain-containing protein [unclassified Pseudomonas]MEE1923384.1 FecR domain-containing protein [Pseudomonas sp. 147P]MEE1934356.1 FecR domain-containing protein [Pseudomonas sp. 148P]